MKLWRFRSKRRLDRAIRHAYELYSEDRDQENLEYLRSARREFPGSAELEILYAVSLLEIRPEEVAAAAQRAVDLAPDNPAILVRAGNLLIGDNNEAARVCLRRARELAEPDFILMAGLENCEGMILAHDGEVALAEKKFRTAMSNEPDIDTYVTNLAKLLAGQGRMTEAIEAIDEALDRVEVKDRLQGLRAKIVADRDKSP